MKSIYDFTLVSIDGTEVPLREYRGKVVLLVNVASKCGLTPQYAGLQELYRDYRERGLVVLGIPSNDFMGQEPGSEKDISAFCTTQYGVDFPMFGKIKVKGPDRHPLYAYLTSEKPHGTDIKWNFHKFLIGRDGRILANVDPKTPPTDLRPEIEKALMSPNQH